MHRSELPVILIDVFWLLGLVLVSTVIGLVIFQVLVRLVKKFPHWEPNDLKKIRKPLIWILIILAVQLFPSFRPDYDLPGWSQMTRILQIFSVAWLLIAILRGGRSMLLRRYDMQVADNLKARKITTQLRVFERIITVLIVVLAVSFALMTFDSIRQIGASILASAGIAGIVIGVAAQKLLANLLAGFQLAITQPIRLDDVVIVENEWGRVEEITLTYVVIRIWDNRRLVVPSTYFIEQPFQNWTRTNSDIMGTIFLYLDYGVSVEAIREETSRLLSKTELWDGKVNVVQVTNASEKTMEVRVLVSATDSGKAWDLRVYLREKLISFLQKNYSEALPKSRVDLMERQYEKK